MLNMTPSQKRSETQMLSALLSKLPATKVCPKCCIEKSCIEEFGTRVLHCQVTRKPLRAAVQSYCKDCRHGKAPTPSKVLAAKLAPAAVAMNWTDAVLLAMAGQGEMATAKVIAEVGAMGSLAEKRASNKNWQAKVRQVLQQLGKKGQATSPRKGVWTLTLGA